MSLQPRPHASKREVGVFRFRFSASNSERVAGMVERGTEIVDRIPDNFSEEFRQRLDDLQLAHHMIGELRIRLGYGSVGISINETFLHPIKVSEVILGPRQLAP